MFQPYHRGHDFKKIKHTLCQESSMQFQLPWPNGHNDSNVFISFCDHLLEVWYFILTNKNPLQSRIFVPSFVPSLVEFDKVILINTNNKITQFKHRYSNTFVGDFVKTIILTWIPGPCKLCFSFVCLCCIMYINIE